MSTIPQTPEASEPGPVIWARMEFKLDQALKDQDAHSERITKNEGRIDKVEDRVSRIEQRAETENLNPRVTAIEKWQWKMIGLSSALSAGLSAGIVLIAK